MAQALIALFSAVTVNTEALARVGRAEGRFLAVRSRLAAFEDPDGSRRLRNGFPAPRGPERAGGRSRLITLGPLGDFVSAALDRADVPSPMRNLRGFV